VPAEVQVSRDEQLRGAEAHALQIDHLVDSGKGLYRREQALAHGRRGGLAGQQAHAAAAQRHRQYRTDEQGGQPVEEGIAGELVTLEGEHRARDEYPGDGHQHRAVVPARIRFTGSFASTCRLVTNGPPSACGRRPEAPLTLAGGSRTGEFLS